MEPSHSGPPSRAVILSRRQPKPTPGSIPPTEVSSRSPRGGRRNPQLFLPLLLRSEWIIARHSSCLPVEHLQSPDRGCLSKLPSTRFGHDSQSFVLRADILCNTVVIMDFDPVGRFGNSGIDIEGTAQSLLKFSRRVLEIRRHEILEFSIPSLAPSPYVGYLKSLQFDLKEGNVHVWREEVGRDEIPLWPTQAIAGAGFRSPESPEQCWCTWECRSACRRSDDFELSRNLAPGFAPAGQDKRLPRPHGYRHAALTRRALDPAIFMVLNDDPQPPGRRMTVLNHRSPQTIRS